MHYFYPFHWWETPTEVYVKGLKYRSIRMGSIFDRYCICISSVFHQYCIHFLRHISMSYLEDIPLFSNTDAISSVVQLYWLSILWTLRLCKTVLRKLNHMRPCSHNSNGLSLKYILRKDPDIHYMEKVFDRTS